MKIRGVRINNRRRAFEIRTSSRRFVLPFAKVDPRPTAADPVVRAFVDREIGSEGFGYALRSGRQGTAHIEQVLEYNKDPDHLRDQLLSVVADQAATRNVQCFRRRSVQLYRIRSAERLGTPCYDRH